MKPIHQELAELNATTTPDHAANPTAIRKKAMDTLARRDHGQGELIDKLAGKGFERRVVEAEVLRLADEGLQSDTRFAENFVQSRVNQGKGPVRIRVELRQKGIPDGIVEAAIEQTAIDWFELAESVRARKFGIARPANFKEKARQMRFLQYRGFESDHIQSIF